MKIHLNLKEVPDGLEPVPAGKYPVMVESAMVLAGKQSGQPYLKLALRITGGEHMGRMLFATASLQPHVLWRVKQYFRALGLDAETIEDMEVDDYTSEVLYPDLLGRVGFAVVATEEYQRSDGATSVRTVVEDIVPATKPTDFPLP